MKILFIMNFIVSHSPKWPCIYIMVGVLWWSLLIFRIAAMVGH
jgi:hypothetical protein